MAPSATMYTAEDIRGIRERLGMSQSQFAEALGCHRMSVSHWERGITRPHWLYARLIRDLVFRQSERKP